MAFLVIRGSGHARADPAVKRSGRRTAPAALRGGRCDRDALLLGLGGQRDRDLDHTIVSLGLDLLGLDTRGQRDRAREGPVPALAPYVVLVLLFLAFLVAAGHGQT